MPEAYLDNSATTRVWPEVLTVMRQALDADYGNPSSLHQRGLDAEKLVQNAREQLAAVVGCRPHELYFTSGGTESNNWACFGLSTLREARGQRIITSAIEHPSVRLPLKALSERGFEVVELPVSSYGEIDLDQLSKVLTEQTILVSIMWVNNEVGSVQPISAIGELIRAHSPHAVFHLDGVQGLGKLSLELTNVDAMSLSGHKLNGPKGIGALYLRRGVRIKPWLLGGEQEGKLRAGTENVPGMLGLAEAAQLTKARSRHLPALRQHLAEGLLSLPGCQLNGPPPERAAPHIVNVSFADAPRGEVLVHALAEREVYVSTGSACHSRRAEASHVLRAMGLRGNALTGAIRLSLSAMSTAADVDNAIKSTATVLEEISIRPRRRGGERP